MPRPWDGRPLTKEENSGSSSEPLLLGVGLPPGHHQIVADAKNTFSFFSIESTIATPFTFKSLFHVRPLASGSHYLYICEQWYNKVIITLSLTFIYPISYYVSIIQPSKGKKNAVLFLLFDIFKAPHIISTAS